MVALQQEESKGDKHENRMELLINSLKPAKKKTQKKKKGKGYQVWAVFVSILQSGCYTYNFTMELKERTIQIKIFHTEQDTK